LHIGNNESHYIKLLLDEIFDRDNFVNEIIWRKGREGGSSRVHSQNAAMPTEYQNIFIYAKHKKRRFWNPILGPYKKSTIQNIEKDEKGWFYTRGRMGRKPAEWELDAGVSLKTYVCDKIDMTKEEVIKLLTSKQAQYVVMGDVWENDFVPNSKVVQYDTEKPEKLLKLVIEAGTNKNDIVMDFFLGSGTTAAACLKLKRQFIGIEQLDEGLEKTRKRLLSVMKGDKKGISKAVNWQGGGDFVYCELKQWNEAYIDKIQRAKTKADLAKIWAVMREKAHISYKIDIKKIDETTAEFEQLDFEDQRRFLLEVLDKNQLYVNYCEIDDTDYKVSEEDKKLNRLFYDGGR